MANVAIDETIKRLRFEKSITKYDYPRIITRYDFPLLILAADAKNTCWVLSWAGTNEKDDVDMPYSSIRDIWYAFPVTEVRRRQILEERISLRKAILENESGIFLFTTRRPLSSSNDMMESKEIGHKSIESDMLPLADISIKGKVLS